MTANQGPNKKKKTAAKKPTKKTTAKKPAPKKKPSAKKKKTATKASGEARDDDAARTEEDAAPRTRKAVEPSVAKPEPDPIVATMPGISDAERDLVQRAFYRGPSALIQAGMSVDEIQHFLHRAEIQSEFQLLQNEFDHRGAFEIRQNFHARQRLAGRLDDAIDVVEDALNDPVYLRDPEDGSIIEKEVKKGVWRPAVLTPGPDPQQVWAAEQILDRLGIHPRYKQEEGRGVDVNVTVLISKAAEQATTELLEDPSAKTDVEKSISRERVRNVMERLAGSVKDGHSTLKAALEKGKGSPKKKPVAKKKKKADESIKGKMSGNS